MNRTFYSCQNNGVTAIVTEKVYEAIGAWKARLRAHQHGQEILDHSLRTEFAEPYPGPVFTFVSQERLDNPDSNSKRYVTGSFDLLNLLVGPAADIRSGDFYVPFSNGLQYRDPAAELQCRTTLQEAIEAFGLEMSTRLTVTV